MDKKTIETQRMGRVELLWICAMSIIHMISRNNRRIIPFIIAPVCIMISCNYQERKLAKTDITAKQDTLSIFQYDSIVIAPISLEAIKSLDFLYTTSGVSTKSESEKLCPKDSTGFFGCYTLINKNTLEQIGTLNVYTTERPEDWRYDSKIERFASIELLNNDIKIWNQTFIGKSKKAVLDFIGNGFHYMKGQTMYSSIGSYDGIFWFSKDTVYRLEIRKTCP